MEHSQYQKDYKNIIYYQTQSSPPAQPMICLILFIFINHNWLCCGFNHKMANFSLYWQEDYDVGHH